MNTLKTYLKGAVFGLIITLCLFTTACKQRSSAPVAPPPQAEDGIPQVRQGYLVVKLAKGKTKFAIEIETDTGEKLDLEGCTESEMESGYYEPTAKIPGSYVAFTVHNDQIKTIRYQGDPDKGLEYIDVRGLPELTQLYCDKNELKTLYVEGSPKLTHLVCNKNNLTELSIKGCSALKDLQCDNNNLSGKVFTRILNDLPTRETGDNATLILYGEDPGEKNNKDFSQPELLKEGFDKAKNEKNWKIYKRDSGGAGKTDI